ncbi:hypothetical protein I8F73_03615 [Enterococcus faecalis]|nr:hypothetical protein [Enterococcus faecalis]
MGDNRCWKNIFQEVGLTLVELPSEFSDDRLIYRGYIKGIANDQRGMVKLKSDAAKIAGMYQVYPGTAIGRISGRRKTMNLSMDELLRYYDGEAFDGFSLLNEEETDLPGSW